MIPGYDAWKTTPPDEPEPVRHCARCGEGMYEGDALFDVDGGVCRECIENEYKTLL